MIAEELRLQSNYRLLCRAAGVLSEAGVAFAALDFTRSAAAIGNSGCPFGPGDRVAEIPRPEAPRALIGIALERIPLVGVRMPVQLRTVILTVVRTLVGEMSRCPPTSRGLAY